VFKKEIPNYIDEGWPLIRTRRVENLLEVTLKDNKKRWKYVSNADRLELLSEVVNFDDDGNYAIEFPLYAHDAEKEAEEYGDRERQFEKYRDAGETGGIIELTRKAEGGGC